MATDHTSQPGQDRVTQEKARLANRLARLQQDLDETIDLLATRERLGQGVPHLTNDNIQSARRGCLAAAVVAYCRAFLESKGGESHAVPMITLKKLPLGSEPWAKETHERVLKARNELVAHSDWQHHNTALIEPGPFRLGSGRVFSLPVLETMIDIEAFTRLAKELHVQAQVRRRDLDEEVINARKGQP